MDLFLVGQYMRTWDTTAYWEIMLRGGMPGYTLCLHELAELEWYFEHHPEACLDPFDAVPRRQSSGRVDFDQVEGYEKAHAWALLVEHRYIQLRAREEGENFSLRELVVANPHGWDSDAEDGWSNWDWDMLENAYRDSLTETDRGWDPMAFEQACTWYAGHGYRRPRWGTAR